MLKRADIRSPQLRPRSARVALELKWEPFEDVIDEALPLLRRHYAELGLAEPFNPDWRSLLFMAAMQKRLRVATARDENGRLVGYCAGLLINYLACMDAKAVMVNALYIEETWRGSLWTIREFLRMMVEFAEEHNAKFLEMGPQGRHRKGIGRMLKYFGWKPSPEPCWRLEL